MWLRFLNQTLWPLLPFAPLAVLLFASSDPPEIMRSPIFASALLFHACVMSVEMLRLVLESEGSVGSRWAIFWICIAGGVFVTATLDFSELLQLYQAQEELLTATEDVLATDRPLSELVPDLEFRLARAAAGLNAKALLLASSGTVGRLACGMLR